MILACPVEPGKTITHIPVPQPLISESPLSESEKNQQQYHLQMQQVAQEQARQQMQQGYWPYNWQQWPAPGVDYAGSYNAMSLGSKQANNERNLLKLSNLPSPRVIPTNAWTPPQSQVDSVEVRSAIGDEGQDDEAVRTKLSTTALK